MDLTPGQISGASFRTVRKGYDPSEVDQLLRDAADALEHAQQQATAMEARARAAVARLQEQSGGIPAPVEPPSGDATPSEAPRLTSDDAENISRTLLLAQRTADQAIAQAEAEAERITGEARSEAERILGEASTEADNTIDSTREMTAQMMDEARVEARRTTEVERRNAIDEVEWLKARREFLLGDVDQLENFLVEQRERLRDAAAEILQVAEQVPGGLGTVTPPPMSASDDDPSENDDESDDAADASDAASDDDTDEMDGPQLSGADGPRARVGAAGDEDIDADDGDEPAAATESDDTPGAVIVEGGTELRLPPEARLPFADASQLAQALDDAELPVDGAGLVPDGSGEVPAIHTSELDVTQAMDRLDQPAPPGSGGGPLGGLNRPHG